MDVSAHMNQFHTSTMLRLMNIFCFSCRVNYCGLMISTKISFSLIWKMCFPSKSSRNTNCPGRFVLLSDHEQITIKTTNLLYCSDDIGIILHFSLIRIENCKTNPLLSAKKRSFRISHITNGGQASLTFTARIKLWLRYLLGHYSNRDCAYTMRK